MSVPMAVTPSMQKAMEACSRTATRIDESRRLLASLESGLANLSNMDARLLASSRTMIDESRRLLAAMERPASTTKTDKVPLPMESNATDALEEAKCNAAMLSVRICPEGTRFDWTLFSPTSQWLGQGSAETELKARTDAFSAGMTYIDRLKHRSRRTITSLH